MPFIVCIGGLKGGIGKTTTAVGLAETAGLGGPVVLIDADAMASAARWASLAEASGNPLRSRVVPYPGANLDRRIGAIVPQDTAITVIDSPPPGDLAVARSAIAAADFLVCPVPPELAVLDRVAATADMARELGVPVMAVLTMVRSRLAEHAAALAALDQWGVPVAKSYLPLAVSVQRNYGHPVGGLLAQFSAALLSEIITEVTDAQR